MKLNASEFHLKCILLCKSGKSKHGNMGILLMVIEWEMFQDLSCTQKEGLNDTKYIKNYIFMQMPLTRSNMNKMRSNLEQNSIPKKLHQNIFKQIDAQTN